MVALAVIFMVGLAYLSCRVAGLSIVQRLAKGHRGRARLACAAVLLAVFALLWATLNLMNALIIFVFLMLFWLICDGVALLVSKVRRPKTEPAATAGNVEAGHPAMTRRDFAGAAALMLCAGYFGSGWVAEHHVRTTRYAFTTGKFAGKVRIVQITDAHLGATYHADRFAEYMDGIAALKPDIMVVTGDFVDDDTSREDMLGACAALARTRPAHGVFFVYGNHDKGYFPEERRGWTNAEMREALEAAGVTVLEDEWVRLACGVTVAGRRDLSLSRPDDPRKSAAELLADADAGTYLLMLDHQPADFEGEAASGADLVLCGHTHGGQFIPINHAGEWLGINDLTYGHECRGATDFIVSSGISNWTFRFKTGCFSEIVVIDVTGQ